MRSRDFVLFLLLLVLPVAFWPGSTSYEQAKFLIWAAAGAAWVLAAAADLWRGDGLPRPTRPVVVAAGAILLAAAVSLVSARSPALAARTLCLILLWMITAAAARSACRTTDDLRRLIAAAVIGTSGACLYGLAQMGGTLPGAPHWSGLPAGISTMGNENYLAGAAAVLAIPSLIVVLGARDAARRALAGAGTLLLLVTLWQADAVGPLLACALAAAVVAPALVMLHLRGPRAARWTLLALVGLVAIGAVVVVGDSVQPGAQEAPVVDSPGRQLLAANHGDVRRTDWLVAARQFLDSPWTGVGIGNYGVLWPSTRAHLERSLRVQDLATNTPVATRAHNDFLQAGAETGTVGIVLLALALVAAARAWSRAWNSAAGDGIRRDQLLMAGGLLTVAIHGLVSFPLHLPTTALLTALLVGGSLSSAVGGAPESAPLRLPRWLAIAPGLLTLVVAGGAIREFVGDLDVARGRYWYIAGSPHAALVHLESGTDMMLWPGEGLVYRGLTHAALGDTAAAIEVLERSRKHWPSHEAALALAEQYIDQRRFDEAADLIAMVELCRPGAKRRAHAAYLAGLVELRQDRDAPAAAAFDRALSIDAHDQRTLLALGYLAARRGDLPEARNRYNEAVTCILAKLDAARSAATTTALGMTVRLREDLRVARRAVDSVN